MGTVKNSPIINRIFKLAKHGGIYETKCKLSPEGIENMVSFGFKVTVLNPSAKKENMFKCIVDWSAPPKGTDAYYLFLISSATLD